MIDGLRIAYGFGALVCLLGRLRHCCWHIAPVNSEAVVSVGDIALLAPAHQSRRCR